MHLEELLASHTRCGSLVDDVADLLTERQTAVRHLVERDAERVKVGSPVGSLSAQNLGSEVVERSLDREAEGSGNLLRQPEVNELDVRLGVSLLPAGGEVRLGL